MSMSHLLQRCNLTSSLAELASEFEKQYDLGRVVGLEPLFAGYDDINCQLTTSRGQYVIKLFSKHKSLEQINSNVTALLRFAEAGIPVPKLSAAKTGEYLYQTANGSGTYGVVMDYFVGKPFTHTPLTKDDVPKLTAVVAGIHSMPRFPTHAGYDMWLTHNLIAEFDQKKQFLDADDLALIEPVVDEMHHLELDRLTQSIVHCDLHRENILKSDGGAYAVLDLASCDYSYSVFDLATFIALFCFEFDEPLAHNQEVYELVMKNYTQLHPLSAYETKQIGLLVKATFAANLLIPRYLQESGEDSNPDQTQYYLGLGRKGLQNTAKIRF